MYSTYETDQFQQDGNLLIIKRNMHIAKERGRARERDRDRAT